MRSPYLLGLVALVVSAIMCFVLSVMAVIYGEVAKAIIELCFVSVDMAVMGYVANEHIRYCRFEKRQKDMEGLFESILREEIRKQQDKGNEPFKEFEE